MAKTKTTKAKKPTPPKSIIELMEEKHPKNDKVGKAMTKTVKQKKQTRAKLKLFK